MKLVKPALLLAVLSLAACQSPPPPPPVVAAPRAFGLAKGIDLPTDASDVLGQLRGFPIEFVARYYRDPASRWPALTAAEVQRLSALGLKIVTVWEWHSADSAYFTYATGYNDALSAARQAKTVGQPTGSAIYFAVDFNARDAALSGIDQYFGGVNAGLAAAGGGRPEYRVGVYGSGAVCASVRQAGLAQYAWLSGSTAWDGSADYASWNIRQAPRAARFANLSFDHDANEARDDYGGFQLGSYPAAGAIVAAAAAAPAAAATLVNSAITSVVASAAEAMPPLPPAAAMPSAPTPAPAARVLASAAPPPPPPPIPRAPIPPALAPPAPKPPVLAPASGNAAAEVAAAAAAEPPATETRTATAHDRTAGRTAKASTPSGRKPVAVAANNRALALPGRHSGGSTTPEPREAEHKASAPRRSQDHVRPQTVKAGAVLPLDKAAHHGGDPRRSGRRQHDEKD